MKFHSGFARWWLKGNWGLLLPSDSSFSCVSILQCMCRPQEVRNNMQLSEQYSTPWTGSSRGSSLRLLVPLPEWNPPDQSHIVIASTAELWDKHVRQISDSCDPSGDPPQLVLCPLHAGLVSCLCPWILLALPCFSISSTTYCFPSESFPAHTPTKYVSSCAYLNGAKCCSKNVFNSEAVWGLQEERHVDKALLRKSAVWLLRWPAVWLKISPI